MEAEQQRRPAEKRWREWELHPPEEVYEASLCALVEFPAIKNGVRRVTLPLNTACKAGASLFSHGPGNLRFTIWQAAFVLPEVS